MMMSIWFLLGYLAALLFFAANPSRIANRASFRTAWVWFAIIPVSNFIFMLFRAGNTKSPRDMALVEIWANGVPWLLLAVSLFALLNALVPGDSGTGPPPR